jgi:HD-GYP domain-containing protein (c-di-GMP phosphodiesterase class II)
MDDLDHQGKLEDLVAARTEQLRKTISNLERSYDVTLEALGDALFLKDPATQVHSKRVTAFSSSMARAMGEAVDQISIIARAAFLHDIGNLAIPGVILRKPSALTSDEV